MRLERIAPCLILAATLALGACGGDDDAPESTPRPSATAPKPTGSIDEAGDRLAAALRSGDCEELFAVARHSSKRDPPAAPDAPVSKRECAQLKRFAADSKGFERRGHGRVFGSAGVVDGRVNGAPVTALFVLDFDGSWKTAVTSGSFPQVGSRPAPGNDFDDNVTAFVKATEEGDCREESRFMSADSEVVDRLGPTGDLFCRGVRRAMDEPRSFFVRLKNDPDARPVPLGKTAEFAFYGLAVRPGIYYTLIASRQPARYPLTREHVRDGVYNWYLARE